MASGINPSYKPPKKGGGGIGGAIGSLGGAVLGGVIGSIVPGVGTIAGAGLGSSLGGVAGGFAGEAISPEKAAVQSETLATEERAPIQSTMKMPEVQLAALQRTKQNLSTSDLPDANQYISMVDQAQAKLKQQMGSFSSLG